MLFCDSVMQSVEDVDPGELPCVDPGEHSPAWTQGSTPLRGPVDPCMLYSVVRSRLAAVGYHSISSSVASTAHVAFVP